MQAPPKQRLRHSYNFYSSRRIRKIRRSKAGKTIREGKGHYSVVPYDYDVCSPGIDLVLVSNSSKVSLMTLFCDEPRRIVSKIMTCHRLLPSAAFSLGSAKARNCRSQDVSRFVILIFFVLYLVRKGRKVEAPQPDKRRMFPHVTIIRPATHSAETGI